MAQQLAMAELELEVAQLVVQQLELVAAQQLDLVVAQLVAVLLVVAALRQLASVACLAATE